MFNDHEFTYKDHKCEIIHDCEPDCIKAFHFVTKPDGEKVLADITPYDSNRITVMAWIDAGYPDRQGCGPLHLKDIKKIQVGS